MLVNTRFTWMLMLLVMATGLISPLYAQEAGAAQGFDLGELSKWSIITA